MYNDEAKSIIDQKNMLAKLKLYNLRASLKNLQRKQREKRKYILNEFKWLSSRIFGSGFWLLPFDIIMKINHFSH